MANRIAVKVANQQFGREFPFRSPSAARRCYHSGMNRFISAVVGIAFTVAALCGARLRADVASQPTTRPAAPAATQNADEPQFLRFVEDADGGGRLQTAVASYANKAGVTVDLIAAVHVGEKAYYEGLNKSFENYDALLYEMVKPRGMGAPVRGQKSRSAVSGFQRFLKDVLHLDYQLDDIDYTKSNFIHADLDAETFSDMESEQGESIFGLMFRSMLHEMARESEGKASKAEPMTLLDLFIAMRAPDRPRQLKLLLARQFGAIEDQMSDLEGPNGTVIITERNKKCIATLKKAIADGKTDIGIFYGAAHMQDMSKRLEALGFHKTASVWRVSWDMTSGIAGTQATTRRTNPPTSSPAGVR
ncbi:MAG TPA: hypothetical protein VG326_12465 [Tepidisphaeraceae bacterium]|jgi:hypothetical protein|nr:hypothetical protein [Tepidisphaeraceae bacterium]